MSKCIYGNTVGGSGLPKSYVLETADGSQRLVGVLVGEETVFDATPNDVREGKIYAGDDGVKTGEKIIPSYNTTEGTKVIKSGDKLEIPLADQDKYDYTQMQAIVCSFNSRMSNSTAAEMVAINSNMYNVQSTTVLVGITKNVAEKKIDLGVTNETTQPQIIRYFTYKEIY